LRENKVALEAADRKLALALLPSLGLLASAGDPTPSQARASRRGKV
jgi:hypothetical protein